MEAIPNIKTHCNVEGDNIEGDKCLAYSEEDICNKVKLECHKGKGNTVTVRWKQHDWIGFTFVVSNLNQTHKTGIEEA